MNRDNLKEKKKGVLSELLVSEKETLEKLTELVKLAKPLFRIDENGKVILKRDYAFSNSEKIELLLIGKYFAFNLEIIGEPYLDIIQISAELGIKKTTLSAPLGNLVEGDLLTKPDSGKYQIVHHEIENILKAIHNKHIK